MAVRARRTRTIESANHLVGVQSARSDLVAWRGKMLPLTPRESRRVRAVRVPGYQIGAVDDRDVRVDEALVAA